MNDLTAGEVATLVEGELLAGSKFATWETVSIDSRTIRPGDLFFAIRGPRHDGHAFVAQALEKGASGFVVSEPVDPPAPAFLIRVPDTTRALQDLAHGVRERAGIRVVGITGSMGKTTTKEAAAAAIGVRRRVLKSRGNLNNFYGLPLSLLELRDEEVAVLEMGMSEPGEIARLTEIARPDVGVLTNVAEVHLEFFPSIEAIAEAKGELLVGLAEGAQAIVNADDPLVLEQARKFAGTVVRFGLEEGADVRGRDIEATDAGMTFTVDDRGQSETVVSRLSGRHNVYNLLAGLAAARALDIPLEEAVSGLREVAPARHRGERLVFDAGFTILDETYNASPRAVRAALSVLAEAPARRRIAVLGDMLELGEAAVDLHRDLGGAVFSFGVDRLLGVGPLGREIVEGARAAGVSEERLAAVDDVREAGRWLERKLRAGDVALLKASRGVALERAIESLEGAKKEEAER